ncbi:maltose ABC transporter substrate-binding protein [Paenibacillus sediminis]|uniref:Arabinogalactan oligomer/maltooligosaccharide transport system substrate-binding protein n=1 Tax=Paenibacillus sediminis TaxID=664909 RepID=A0ABS4H345_9BACL|nr:maltose ABC transporter substrate-binding protein [Paenibacillus sediminis]MBP1936959.1 arabinogalactan oligomer/maltooligosaccharide transport system substrate-binding protein [Paenibacillus sediminis]
MKKWVSILLVLTLTIVISACGSKTSQPAETTTPATTDTTTPSTDTTTTEPAADADITPEPGAKLVVWEGKIEKPFYEEMAKEFTAKYNIPVEFQEVEPTDQMAKLKTDGPAGLGADVLNMPHDHLGEAVAAGLVLPNDFYEEDTKANFAKAAVDAVTMNGVLYGYPRNMETYLLYYNKNLVKDEDLKSWDSIIKFAKSYNDPAKNKFGFMWEVNNWYFNYAFIAGSGGYVFGKNGTDPTDIGINSPGAVEGMKFFQSLREALPIKAADATGDVKTELFQTGKLPINLDGVWQLGNFTKEKLGFEVGAVPMPPMPNGKSPITFAGVKAYFVSSYSQYPNAAKLFIHFVTSQEALSKEYKISGIIPARNGMENDPEIQKDPRAQAFIEQFKNSQAMPSILEMRSVWGPATASLEPIWNGEDVQKTLDKAVADIKTSIQEQAGK